MFLAHMFLRMFLVVGLRQATQQTRQVVAQLRVLFTTQRIQILHQSVFSFLRQLST